MDREPAPMAFNDVAAFEAEPWMGMRNINSVLQHSRDHGCQMLSGVFQHVPACITAVIVCIVTLRCS